MNQGARKNALPFRHHLVLNQWIFSLFGLDSVNGYFEAEPGKPIATLDAFRERFNLRGETTGRNAEGIHLIIQRICEYLPDDAKLSNETLLEYDRRIQQHTEKINNGRRIRGLDSIEWKYFQYLMLLFTEIYLDFLFTKPRDLIAGLNEQINRWNAKWIVEGKFKHDPLEPFDPRDDLWPQLNLVAYWSATGSGKTLVMHANILQYRFYQDRYGAEYRDAAGSGSYGKAPRLNNIILLTPNEGLTRQHLAELHASGIGAREFSHNAGDLFAHDVVVIDIHKIAERQGDKTVAVGAFGDNNLLLVDEGHRGTASGSDGVWYRYRRQLASKGFTFEYSATFAQSAISDKMNKDLGISLRQSYAKSILFDYSYRYFFADGYGKQSQVLNIEKDVEQNLFQYQVASLLSFYQQIHLYETHGEQLALFNLAKPLWVFVTSRVTASDYSAPVANDMVESLSFIDQILIDRDSAIAAIKTLLSEGLVGRGGVNHLDGRFDYLKQLGYSPEMLYADILKRVFHSSGGRLYLENISGAQGEVALRAGEAGSTFGVINIGDPNKLLKLCEEAGLLVQESRFGESLFDTINDDGSQVNLLLGSRKFSEGWSSWRVSNMTLMRVGLGEGAQIIQLFGRGVRLKGWQMSLKRSADIAVQLHREGIERPPFINILETLNIFGLNANYIDTFRKQLEDEDVQISDGVTEFVLPLQPIDGLPQDLSVIQVKDQVANHAIGGAGSAFKELAEQVLLEVPGKLTKSEQAYFYNEPKVKIDFYPRMGGFSTMGDASEQQRRRQKLTSKHVALLNTEKLYFEMLAFKRSKRWSNINITLESIEGLLADTNWYVLYAPSQMMELGALNNLTLWHDMAISLLRKYCELFYNFRRKQWESDKLEYRSIALDKSYAPNVRKDLPHGGYLLTIDPVKQNTIVRQLEVIRDKIITGQINAWPGNVVGNNLRFLFNERHVYQPLLSLISKNNEFRVTPVPLNDGEERFVQSLQAAWEDEQFPKGADVYLLRNVSGKNAIGVFIDGGFEPDFILWIKHGGIQHVVFIDPKGLRQEREGPNSPKVQFYRTVKNLEREMQANGAEKTIQLHSFLVSQTSSDTLTSHWREHQGKPITKERLESWNILFPDEDRDYLVKMISKIIPD